MSRVAQNIHFIGIGGIGISGLARIYLEKGHKIFGSDLVASEITKDLEKRGVKVKIGRHKKENLPVRTALVIYNLAIPQDNPELQEARKQKIKCLTYPQALGELTKKYFTICVSGTHGKTTTTGMVSLILLAAGLDPTIIIGSKLKELGGSNARLGKSKYLVIEADEYKRAFLNYKPNIVVIANIEAEHLDYYKDLKDVQKAFAEFVELLPSDGLLVTDSKIASLLHCFIVKKGIKVINYEQGPQAEIEKVLPIPGEHNVENAQAAFAVARHLGIKKERIYQVLRKYQGAWRRFEIKYDNKITIIDDYGHHPTEIKATLAAGRERYGKRRLWCVFQPHQIERTKKLFAGFTKAFGDADKIIITKIFRVSGRDKVSKQALISPSKKLVQELKKQGLDAIYLEDFTQIINYLSEEVKKGDVIIVMGAGDINQLTPKLIQKIKTQRRF